MKKKRVIILLATWCVWLMATLPGSAQPGQTPSKLEAQKARFTLTPRVEAAPQTGAEYQSITGKQRVEWFAISTVGPSSLTGGLFSAGLGTAMDTPTEYGPHWEGFGKRYGMRLTGVSMGNLMEAGLGAAWGEDPRYFHAEGRPFGRRVENIVDLTFRAYEPDGQRHLAKARYAATVGNNFLSNLWRTDSEADWQHALIRTAEGFGGRALSNTVSEFLPQVWRKIRQRHHGGSAVKLPGPSSGRRWTGARVR
ncbi:hypothetical protein [Occallatibacter riparius]|uniref:Uncharacterized protein n=1 Tax=Occallatibacter riparius TaxID=1002689 RepID=A0A9J7BHL2_9BACT|nr:hypothetical protein [Occallatibacter riparius]UWZ82207.1 hypothetical protein MOP44_16680 [Occallatibacter riparius]